MIGIVFEHVNLHTFVLWALDWRRIEQTLHSRRSPPETEVFLSGQVVCQSILKCQLLAKITHHLPNQILEQKYMSRPPLLKLCVKLNQPRLKL